MTEGKKGKSSHSKGMDQLTQRLLHDLARLARAQARLTTDLVQLLERLDGQEEQFGLQIDTEEAESISRKDPPGDSSKVHDRGKVRDGAPGRPEVDRPETPGEPTGRSTTLTVAPDWEAKAIPSEPETEQEEPESESHDATVLILESGSARVGVLWDQVVQIGTIQDTTVPKQVETDHGAVDLVSLGLLLHGISREEQYFVVLAQEGERAAVAFERTLGLSSTDSNEGAGQERPIQVLRVDLLRTFSRSPRVTRPDRSESSERSPERIAEEEERDRKGPKRALVAVRYLPARVAICRFLRGRGWQVGEAAGLEAAIVSLDLGRWDALFLEARTNGNPDEAEKALMNRVGELGVPVIRVGSRISGYPTAGGPALMFPFSESELESILVVTEEKASS